MKTLRNIPKKDLRMLEHRGWCKYDTTISMNTVYDIESFHKCAIKNKLRMCFDGRYITIYNDN